MRHEVQSSMILAIEETSRGTMTGRGTMIVEFTNRGKYEYFGVPTDTIHDFINSNSVGKFFNENIRGQYREEFLS